MERYRRAVGNGMSEMRADRCTAIVFWLAVIALTPHPPALRE